MIISSRFEENKFTYRCFSGIDSAIPSTRFALSWNYLVMPYMPPSEASFSLPCLLFAAITQGGVDEVGGLDIDVGDQGEVIATW